MIRRVGKNSNLKLYKKRDRNNGKKNVCIIINDGVGALGELDERALLYFSI